MDLRGLEPPSSTCKADILPIETTDPQSLPRDLNPDLKNKDWILSPTRLPIPPERDALGGTRTHNLLINSQLLYQLSYKGLYPYLIIYSAQWDSNPQETFSTVFKTAAIPILPCALYVLFNLFYLIKSGRGRIRTYTYRA